MVRKLGSTGVQMKSDPSKRRHSQKKDVRSWSGHSGRGGVKRRYCFWVGLTTGDRISDEIRGFLAGYFLDL